MSPAAQSSTAKRLGAVAGASPATRTPGDLIAAEPRCRLQLVEALLAGEPVDTAKLGYGLGDWHLAAIARGPAAAETIRALATALDRRLLLLETRSGETWAWLGGRRRLPAAEAMKLLSPRRPAAICLALGEPGEGIEGWRTSHRQAEAALAVAVRLEGGVACHGEAALLASALGDELLSTSLRAAYLAPLERERDGGATLRETLRAYFAAKRNASSAAAALGVARQTVTTRLRLFPAV